jgi:hypothetical protein
LWDFADFGVESIFEEFSTALEPASFFELVGFLVVGAGELESEEQIGFFLLCRQ